jgi:hypothetical protein
MLTEKNGVGQGARKEKRECIYILDRIFRPAATLFNAVFRSVRNKKADARASAFCTVR